MSLITQYQVLREALKDILGTSVLNVFDNREQSDLMYLESHFMEFDDASCLDKKRMTTLLDLKFSEIVDIPKYDSTFCTDFDNMKYFTNVFVADNSIDDKWIAWIVEKVLTLSRF